MEQIENHRTRRFSGQILVLALIGAGLLLLGGVALALLPDLVGKSTLKPAASGVYISAVPAQVDFPAPKVELTDLDGRRVSLVDFHGQVVLVNHWATWCPPCKAEMPVLQDYYDANRDNGFTLVAIEAGERQEEVAGFVKEFGLTFPVWSDPKRSAMRAFREEYLPASYVIDPSGRVVLYWGGAISREMLEKFVTPLLGRAAHGSKG